MNLLNKIIPELISAQDVKQSVKLIDCLISHSHLSPSACALLLQSDTPKSTGEAVQDFVAARLHVLLKSLGDSEPL